MVIIKYNILNRTLYHPRHPFAGLYQHLQSFSTSSKAQAITCSPLHFFIFEQNPTEHMLTDNIKYFTLDGIRLRRLPDNGVVIVVNHMADGSIVTDKRVL